MNDVHSAARARGKTASQGLHCQEGRHQLDSVPEILDPEVLVEAMLVVVVIAHPDSDRRHASRLHRRISPNEPIDREAARPDPVQRSLPRALA